MRIISSIILAVLPFTASAFDFQNMGQGDMQEMMKNMQKMQQCISSINQDELDQLQSRSEKFSASIKSLCKKGSRDEAQKKAISYSKKMIKEPVMLEMKKCGDMAKGMMPDMPLTFTEEDIEQGKAAHVCDSVDEL